MGELLPLCCRTKIFIVFLQIKDQFHNQNFAQRAVTAGKHDFDSEFNSLLKKEMVKHSLLSLKYCNMTLQYYVCNKKNREDYMLEGVEKTCNIY